jgi:hypothetical protein
MGFLRRSARESPEPGPDWAQPMSQHDASHFLEAVARELESRELPSELGQGEVRVQRGEWSTYGLSNLAQLCHHVGRKEWEGAIARHFDNLFAAADAEGEFEELSQDFERVRPLLKVRLYASEKARARSRRASTGGATRP